MSTGVVFGTLAEQYEKLRAERFEKIATANIPEELRSKFIVVELEEMWTSLGSNPWAICCMQRTRFATLPATLKMSRGALVAGKPSR